MESLVLYSSGLNNRCLSRSGLDTYNKNYNTKKFSSTVARKNLHIIIIIVTHLDHMTLHTSSDWMHLRVVSYNLTAQGAERIGENVWSLTWICLVWSRNGHGPLCRGAKFRANVQTLLSLKGSGFFSFVFTISFIFLDISMYQRFSFQLVTNYSVCSQQQRWILPA